MVSYLQCLAQSGYSALQPVSCMTFRKMATSSGVIVSYLTSRSFDYSNISAVGEGPLYRRAGLSGGLVGEIVPEELYAGCSSQAETDSA